MKPTEFRIGNYVTGIVYDEDSNLADENGLVEMTCKILGLDSVGFSEHSYWVESLDKNLNYEMYHDFEKIPLTDEWFFKCNFIGHHDGFYNEVMMFKPITKDRREWQISLYPNKLGSAVTPKGKIFSYLHELQNIYYELTGTELPINIK